MLRFHRLFFRIICILTLVASPVAGAVGASSKEVVATLENGYRTLSDLQADFTQHTAIASLNREETGGGELFIKKSAGGTAMFRFDYRKPRQQIVSNGKTVWYYLPDNKQVMTTDVASLFEGGGAIALNYLTGMGRLSADFTSSFADQARTAKGDYVVDLVPRKKNAVMVKLRLTISARAVDEFLASGSAGEAFPVISSVVYDQMGNQTRIEFSKVRVNRGIGSDRFNFKIPRGVEVIKPK